MDTRIDKDAALIASLGGPAKVADLLGLDKKRGGVQRVCNWLVRGIPAEVKLSRPDLFLRDLSKAKPRRKAVELA